LFYVFVGNQWPVIMEGAVGAMQNKLIPRCFFIVFHISSVLLFLNVLIAFIIELYSSTLDRIKLREKGGLIQDTWQALIAAAIQRNSGEDNSNVASQFKVLMTSSGRKSSTIKLLSISDDMVWELSKPDSVFDVYKQTVVKDPRHSFILPNTIGPTSLMDGVAGRVSDLSINSNNNIDGKVVPLLFGASLNELSPVKNIARLSSKGGLIEREVTTRESQEFKMEGEKDGFDG
jgi:hypothetical protein